MSPVVVIIVVLVVLVVAYFAVTATQKSRADALFGPASGRAARERALNQFGDQSMAAALAASQADNAAFTFGAPAAHHGRT